jgi:predicted DNA-binding protein
MTNTVSTKLTKVMVYMPPELKERLETLAEKENRSLSNLIVTIAQQWADDR